MMANEKRLIDANTLVEFVGTRTSSWIYKPDLFWAIEQQPTEDAVEVVRCKDCKHSEPCGESRQCLHPFGLNICDGNDFCSYGERREGE